MQRYLLKIILFLVLLLFLDWSAYKCVSVMFKRVETGSRTGGIINMARRIKAEVVVIGSSRASHHYDPRILSKGLGATVFNAGCDGQGIPYVRALSNLLMLDYAPRMLIIDLDPESFERKTNKGPMIIAPFMNESEVVRNIVLRRSNLEFIKYFSKSYVYNGMVLPIIGRLYIRDNGVLGFVPLSRIVEKETLDKQAKSRKNSTPEEDAYSLELLRETVDEARSKETRVFLVSGPRWTPGFAQSPINVYLQNILVKVAERNRVPLFIIDQSNFPVFQDSSLFFDPTHLNKKGAAIFSEILLEKIREYSSPKGDMDAWP